jgi:hypothetical protein
MGTAGVAIYPFPRTKSSTLKQTGRKGGKTAERLGFQGRPAAQKISILEKAE